MTPVTLVLICGDHNLYFDLRRQCVLREMPGPLLVLANRASAVVLEEACPGLEIRRVQWSDEDRLLEEVLELARTRLLAAVSTANEGLMDLAGRIRAGLGLPGMGPRLVARFRDKLLMKQLLDARGMRVPAYARCDARAAVEALLARHRKLVLKPVDELGSRGVSFVSSHAELDAWYAQGHALSRFEAEEFIDGAMYHVNSVVRGGAVLLSASALYLPGMASIDFHRGTPLVTVMVEDAELTRRLAAYSRQVLDVLGLADGVAHLECFVTADGEIVLCEVAARPPGAGIVQMIEAQYGLHVTRAQLLLDSGHGAGLEPVAPRPGVAGLMAFRTARGGTIREIAAGADFAEPWIGMVSLPFGSGSIVRAARMSSDVLGLLIFSGASHAEFMARRALLQQRFDDSLVLDPVARSAPRAALQEVV